MSFFKVNLREWWRTKVFEPRRICGNNNTAKRAFFPAKTLPEASGADGAPTAGAAAVRDLTGSEPIAATVCATHAAHSGVAHRPPILL